MYRWPCLRIVSHLIGALVPLVLSIPAAHAEELFFRYENAQGVTVIDDHVPPRFAHKGYAVLNKHGRVVEVVARTLTAEERKNPQSAAVRARLRAEEELRQRKYDDELLRRYSSVSDIEDAQNRKVNEIKLKINSLKSTIASLSDQIEQRQGEAAELERAGGKAPADLLQTITTLRGEIAEAEKNLHVYEAERRTTEARFQYDLQRLRELNPVSPSPPQPPPPILILDPDEQSPT